MPRASQIHLPSLVLFVVGIFIGAWAMDWGMREVPEILSTIGPLALLGWIMSLFMVRWALFDEVGLPTPPDVQCDTEDSPPPEH